VAGVDIGESVGLSGGVCTVLFVVDTIGVVAAAYFLYSSFICGYTRSEVGCRRQVLFFFFFFSNKSEITSVDRDVE